MKLGKVHLNIGTEEKPHSKCGRRAKYIGYANKTNFIHALEFNDRCIFCWQKMIDEDTQDYWNHSATAQLKKKDVLHSSYKGHVIAK